MCRTVGVIMKRFLLVPLFLTTIFSSISDDQSRVSIFHQLYGVPYSPELAQPNSLKALDFHAPERAVERWYTHKFGDSSNTRARLITDNMEAWYARWHLLQSARKTIDIQYFIVKDDIFGHAMMGILLKKARAGVQIRLMVDDFGTGSLVKSEYGGEFLKELVKTGNVHVKVFNPRMSLGAFLKMPITLNFFKDISVVLASNHDKIMIVDSKRTIVGGRNISKDYLADEKDNEKAYRDTDVLLEGEDVISQIQVAFEEEYVRLKNQEILSEEAIDQEKVRYLFLAAKVMKRWMSSESMLNPEAVPALAHIIEELNEKISKFSLLKNYSTWVPFQGQRELPVTILDKNSRASAEVKDEIGPTLLELVENAEEEIIIQNAYVVLSDIGKEALTRAVERGVRLVLLTNSPQSSTLDTLVVQAVFARDLRDIVEVMPPEVQIYGRTGSHLHAKVFIIDGSITVIGTYNLDQQSERVNSEIVAMIKSRDFAQRNRLLVEKDLAQTTRYQVIRDENGKIIKRVLPSLNKGWIKDKLFFLLGKVGALFRPLI